MQEQIEREAIAITLQAAKLSAEILAKTLKTIAEQIKKEHSKAQKGCQTVKNLMNQNCETNTIPIEGDKKLFEQVARKWHVDYAFHKSGKNKYVLLFKSGQADAITGAFSEYSAKVMKRAKNKQRPIKEVLEKAEKQVKRESTKHKQHSRTKQAVRA